LSLIHPLTPLIPTPTRGEGNARSLSLIHPLTPLIISTARGERNARSLSLRDRYALRRSKQSLKTHLFSLARHDRFTV